MKILHTKEEVKSALLAHRKENNSIGLVPTMGALHDGHISLVKHARSHADITITSIFVNPIQFNNPSDLEHYPRTLEKDLELLENKGVDYVFLPEIEEMYQEETLLKFDFGYLENTLEGEFRPSHFNGVGIVVSKLFHIVQPDYAYFGQKDLQQVAIIKRLVKDLSFDVKVEVVPTIREKDGLAMSSRNVRLGEEERKAALLLFNSLNLAKDELLKGISWLEVKEKVLSKFDQEPLAKLEYFELVETDSLKKLNSFNPRELDDTKKYSVCMASFIGEVRLIDNLPIY
ncbi:pantoate--beta-alanine ligase [Echinicola jeungdonensis]|uniref:Pantothenate synthetase n=1 Tax=Echinicola jeungdonensis TaxID=709343 RepID=A0ABV5J245_9BACT|nr:pantoate--beta-alanine ligase [Echinicola jeungdonensis]MDN3669024.1 pantoate--beta-alanine ligase [Echinicola jeungdonensis]